MSLKDSGDAVKDNKAITHALNDQFKVWVVHSLVTFSDLEKPPTSHVENVYIVLRAAMHNAWLHY